MKTKTKTRKNNRKTVNKAVRKQKGQSGKKGTPGAPKKEIRFPKTVFTIDRISDMNSGVCNLTVRTRVRDMIKSGEIVRVVDKNVTSAGRPARQYLLKENVTKDTVLFDGKNSGKTSSSKTRKASSKKSVASENPVDVVLTPVMEPVPPVLDIVKLATTEPEPVSVVTEPAPEPVAVSDDIPPVVPVPLP